MQAAQVGKSNRDSRRKDKRNMKKILLILLLIGVVSFGCQQEQVITQLEVGRSKLLNAGLSLEAAQHLENAEREEENLSLIHI